jgi:glycosyltransferase involved in cell wall biosynthesis
VYKDISGPAQKRSGRALFLLTSDRMGGAERVTSTLAREAASSQLFDGVDIFVLAWNRSGTLDQLESECNVRLHYAHASKQYRGIGSLIRFVAKRRFAFVFGSATHLNALASALRRLGLLRTNWLVTRESTAIFERNFDGSGRLARVLYWFYGAQDLIVCQTERMRLALSLKTRHRLDAKLTVIPNPIDARRIEAARRAPPPVEILAIPPGRTLIVWCGRLSPVKSPTRAIEVLHLLHEGGLNSAHLVVIGDGPLRDEMTQQVADAGLNDFVTFAGHQDNPAVWMASAHLGLVTSDVEGFPNVILEMLGSGVPAIVTTDCAGELDQMPRAWLSPSTDPLAISKTALAALGSESPLDVDGYLEQRSPAAVLRDLMGSNYRQNPAAGLER